MPAIYGYDAAFKRSGQATFWPYTFYTFLICRRPFRKQSILYTYFVTRSTAKSRTVWGRFHKWERGNTAVWRKAASAAALWTALFAAGRWKSRINIPEFSNHTARRKLWKKRWNAVHSISKAENFSKIWLLTAGKDLTVYTNCNIIVNCIKMTRLII